jgi:hypothetical protein
VYVVKECKSVDNIIRFLDVKERILDIREHKVILDRDIAALYGVETKDINRAVKNNPDKFPEGYIIEITTEEWLSLRLKYFTLESSLGKGEHTKYTPKAFTEKGLYMITGLRFLAMKPQLN